MLGRIAEKQRVAQYDNMLLAKVFAEGRLAQGAAEGLRDTGKIGPLGATALQWLALDLHARLIIDERCEILWWNDAAKELLSRQSGLEVRGDVLAVVDGSSQAKLRCLLQEARHKPTSTCIEQTGNEGWLVLRCVGVTSSADLMFCLAISRAGDGEVWRFDHLAECFGLTPAEHRVLQDLLAGYEAEALSTRLAVSIETTRTHIKSIYAKVGVNTREGLFARVRGFRA